MVEIVINKEGHRMSANSSIARVSPDGWRRALWVALIVAASAAFSFGFACACPFAALGAAAAITLPRRDALLLAGGTWVANQAIGFSLLHYPTDANTLAWGVVLGVVTILATLAAQAVQHVLAKRDGIAVAAVAFISAFLVYEGGLYVAAATALGGTEDFAIGIIGEIVEINSAAFLVLLALSRVGVRIGFVAKPVLGLPGRMEHA